MWILQTLKHSLYVNRELLFDENNQLRKEGDEITNLNYAATLEMIRDNPEGFYTGELSKNIVRDMAVVHRGGLVTAEDLGNYSAILHEALENKLGGLTMHTTPAPTSGPVIALVLNILKGMVIIVIIINNNNNNNNMYKKQKQNKSGNNNDNNDKIWQRQLTMTTTAKSAARATTTLIATANTSNNSYDNYNENHSKSNKNNNNNHHNNKNKNINSSKMRRNNSNSNSINNTRSGSSKNRRHLQ